MVKDTQRQANLPFPRLKGSQTYTQAPNLEEFIEDKDLPDVVEVYVEGSKTASLYKLCWPLPSAGPIRETVDIVLKRTLGSGNQATVYEATLTLPLSIRRPGLSAVSVAAKTGNGPDGIADLWKEASAYAHLSESTNRHLQQDWNDRFDFSFPSNAYPFMQYWNEKPKSSPFIAVVPKFYGFYVPMTLEGEESDASPILLIENCGETLQKFCQAGRLSASGQMDMGLVKSIDFKTLAMFEILRSSGFQQGSIKADNVAIQPGPLSAPKFERSWNTPSLRVIDFGRAAALINKENSLTQRWWPTVAQQKKAIDFVSQVAFDEMTREAKVAIDRMLLGRVVRDMKNRVRREMQEKQAREMRTHTERWTKKDMTREQRDLVGLWSSGSW